MGESKLQRKIIRDLRLSGWKVLKIVLSNEPGNPDVLAGKNSRMVWIEVKDQGEEPEPLQELRHQEWRDHGFEVFVVDTWEHYMQIKYLSL
jgi:hypothetical protein